MIVTEEPFSGSLRNRYCCMSPIFGLSKLGGERKILNPELDGEKHRIPDS